jgi:hypothetical protein
MKSFSVAWMSAFDVDGVGPCAPFSTLTARLRSRSGTVV